MRNVKLFLNIDMQGKLLFEEFIFINTFTSNVMASVSQCASELFTVLFVVVVVV